MLQINGQLHFVTWDTCRIPKTKQYKTWFAFSFPKRNTVSLMSLWSEENVGNSSSLGSVNTTIPQCRCQGRRESVSQAQLSPWDAWQWLSCRHSWARVGTAAWCSAWGLPPLPFLKSTLHTFVFKKCNVSSKLNSPKEFIAVDFRNLYNHPSPLDFCIVTDMSIVMCPLAG